MEKLKMHTPDLTQDHVARIRELFPNCVTEVKDEGRRMNDESSSLNPHHSSLRYAIDFDLLRQELSGHIVEGPQERYHLNWPGKREALLTANAPIAKTLRPCREESVDFDTTQNLFIEGDNLDALKLLQETYLGKVKMIYIDPPYNTGNDFIYEDDFVENMDDFLKRSNQKDEQGNRLIANTEANGRFHSDWLSTMYPRLKLARNLLRDDGILFISINDVEQANLRKLCEDVFGAVNIIAQITWKARVKPVNIGDAKYRPQKEVEYVLIVQKTQISGSFYPLFTGGIRSYPHETGGRKYRTATILKSNRGVNYRSTMSFKLGDYEPPEGQRWQAGEDIITQLNNDGYIEFRDGTPFRRYFEDEEGAEHDPFYCFMESDWSSTSEVGKHQLNEILGNQHGFDTVKPVKLLKTLIQTSTAANENHLILDFFAGSGTTAQAVMGANSEDGGNRSFVVVQMPEPCLIKSGNSSQNFKVVSEIAKERIRRAGKKILEGQSNENWNKDIGFRVLKIDTSNMAEVYYTPDKVQQATLFDAVNNIKPDRSPEDLLFQVLLDWGVDLTLTIERKMMKVELGRMNDKNSSLNPHPSSLPKEYEVFFVDGNALVACFDTGITEDLVKELAAEKPLRVVFRDNGFVSDAVKINAEQIFKQLSPTTDVKSI